jgi:hypothetical protein
VRPVHTVSYNSASAASEPYLVLDIEDLSKLELCVVRHVVSGAVDLGGAVGLVGYSSLYASLMGESEIWAGCWWCGGC